MTMISETVQMPMRDGVILAADVYRPQTETRLPVLVQRTPYDKDMAVSPALLRFVQAGYAVVVQDVRGRFASAGEFLPFAHEAEDGAETIAWAAAQPWSNGRVGMIGGSYVGATQWQAASQQPPALAAIALQVTATDLQAHWCFQGGAVELGFLRYWLLNSLLPGEVQRQIAAGSLPTTALDSLLDQIDDLPANYRVPDTEHLPFFELAPYYRDWLRHVEAAAYWARLSPATNFAQMKVPALSIGGWYDIFIKGTLASYAGMRAHGGSAMARQGQRLIIGPWTHGVQGGIFAEQSFGARAHADASDIVGQQLSWFDHWLRDQPLVGAPVRLFVMGSNTWHDATEWPLPGTTYQPYYLHSGGHANTADGDGWLGPVSPTNEPEDVFRYDPHDPMPTLGGQTLLSGHAVAARSGPWDHRLVEARVDVLCYTTAVLTKALSVIGPLTLVLHISSSAVDTDFIGRVLDIWPDGRAMMLTDGILRARYRHGMEHAALLHPSEHYELHIDLGATATVFLPGHRLRLEVTSSNFPRFDPNPNTGAGFLEASVPVPALNTIWHDRVHPSHLLVPLAEVA